MRLIAKLQTPEADPFLQIRRLARTSRLAAVAGAGIEVFRHVGGCTHLLDDPVPRVALDNSFHIDNKVGLTDHDEVRRVLTQPLVLFPGSS